MNVLLPLAAVTVWYSRGPTALGLVILLAIIGVVCWLGRGKFPRNVILMLIGVGIVVFCWWLIGMLAGVDGAI